MISPQILSRVIADQSEELSFLSKNNYIERDILPTAKRFIDEKLIKVITGVRRCGKSSLCLQLLNKSNFSYFNFDDERLLTLQSDDLDLVFEQLLKINPKTEYFFFDEIQNVNGWELFVNRLQRQGYNIIITGSNSKMLSRELTTHLTGRYVQFEVYPFSFKEFLKQHNIKIPNSSKLSTKIISEINFHLNLYLQIGGFPETAKLENKKRYLRDLFDTIILKDIVQRFKIREIIALKETALQLINNYGNLYTLNRIKNNLNLSSINTVKDFINYLEEAYLLFSTSKYSNKFHETIRSAKKSYCIDTGFANSLSSQLTDNFGRLMENIVYLQLKRDFIDISYLSTNNFEIDFVVNKGDKKITLIQVAHDISNKDTLERELKAFKLSKNIIQNVDYFLINESIDDEIIHDGMQIKIIPLWKFLLNLENS